MRYREDPRGEANWRVTQRRAVESTCAGGDVHVWVATEAARTLGFVALKLHADDRMGEIYMITVDPDFQRRGVATALTRHSLAWFKLQDRAGTLVPHGARSAQLAPTARPTSAAITTAT